MLANNFTKIESLDSNPSKYQGPDFTGNDTLLKKLQELPLTTAGKSNLFDVKSANEWIEVAKGKPAQKKLFGTLFFENEICILFADTNLGKSILAVQIGESVSSGSRIPPFELEAPPQKALYIDFELSEKQFQIRYSEGNLHYKFHTNFYRAELDPEIEEVPPSYESFEDYLIKSLESQIISTGSKVVIVDNITYLRSNNETAKDALPLMKQLKALKKKHSLSILILAHTPKRDGSNPLGKNDLGGSKMLINFCDSAFAIGESRQDSKIRYIKQIKVRNAENFYDADNVVLFEVRKENCFLQFKFISFGSEQEHLRMADKKDNESRMAEALELQKQGWPNTKIAQHFGVSEGAVRKWFKKK